MRIRFTIRDLVWLTVVAALAVGWWLDHRQMADALKRGFEVKVTEVHEAEERAESAATFLDTHNRLLVKARGHFIWNGERLAGVQGRQ